MSNVIEVVVSSTDDTSAGFKSANKNAREMGKGFDKAGEAADGAEGKAQGFSDTLTGTKDLMGGVGEIAKGNLFEGFVQAGQGAADLAGGMAEFLIPLGKSTIAMVKNKAATIASTAAGLAASAAQKTMAAAQWLLNAAMTANPIGLVVVAIIALVAIFVIAYKKSETFRNIVNEAFSAVGRGAIEMAKVGLSAFRFLTQAALDAAGTLLALAAKIPGPQQAAMKKASEAFNGFKESVNKTFDAAGHKLDKWSDDLKNMPKIARLQGDITDLNTKLEAAKTKLKDPKLTATKTAAIKADIRNLQAQIAAAQAKVDSLKGKTVKITVNTYKNLIETKITGGELIRQASGGQVKGFASGGQLRGFASGGSGASGRIMVGEDGAEMLDLYGGSGRVTPAANTRQRQRQETQAQAQTVVWRVETGGSRMDELLAELIRKFVKVGGGNVQEVLGS